MNKFVMKKEHLKDLNLEKIEAEVKLLHSVSLVLESGLQSLNDDFIEKLNGASVWIGLSTGFLEAAINLKNGLASFESLVSKQREAKDE